MPAKPWKDDPVAWEKLYDDQHIVSLASLGFPQFERTRIVAEEKPEVFLSLESRIQQRWTAFQQENPKAFNSKKNSVRDKEALDVDGNTLVIRVYESDFASLLYNLNRDEAENSTLDAEQRYFLDNNLHFLGVTGYIGGTFVPMRHGKILHDKKQKSDLCGKAAGLKLKSGLWELVPSGFVDPGKDCEQALASELSQETGLDYDDDIVFAKPTHMNFSPKYGNCTVIYNLSINPESINNIKCSPEHGRLGWLNPEWMLDRENRYIMSPAPLKVIEDLHPELKQ